jgi:hypothetical protein
MIDIDDEHDDYDDNNDDDYILRNWKIRNKFLNTYSLLGTDFKLFSLF